MARWTRGEADVEALITAGELQELSGAAANGERLIARAALTLKTARTALESDPDSALASIHRSAPG